MKALIVVSQTDFQPMEYGDTRAEIEQAGIKVDVASFEKVDAIGTDGTVAEVDVTIHEAKPIDYDAIVLIGGPGAGRQLVGNEDVINLVKDFDEGHKIVAAICISPLVLAEAHLLKDRKATVWNGDGEQKEKIGAMGGTYLEQDVVVDTRIVTANGPMAAKKFGQTVAKLIKEGVGPEKEI